MMRTKGIFDLCSETETAKRRSRERKADFFEIHERREKAKAKKEGRIYKNAGEKYMDRMMSYYGKS